MSTVIQLGAKSDPFYNYPWYSNLLGTNQNPDRAYWIDIAKRVAKAAIPFLKMCKPLKFPISLASSAWGTWTNGSELYAKGLSGDIKKILYPLLKTIIAVIGLVSIILGSSIGIVIAMGHSLIKSTIQLINNISKKDYKKALGNLVDIIKNTLFLALLFYGGWQIAIVYLTLQTLLCLNKSYAQFMKENYIEAMASFLMSFSNGIRLSNQATAPKKD